MNPGVAFDPAWFATHPEWPAPPAGRRLRPDERGVAIACIDLTTLQGDDDAARVGRLCDQAKAAGVAAVCVFPVFVPNALTRLEGSGIAVATVAGGFPHGLSPLRSRVAEVSASAALGAQEIDVVIRRDLANDGRWGELCEEVWAMKEAAESAHLKVILATGELNGPVTIYRAALAALVGGADFVKTSTGKETVNATLEAGSAMVAAIRFYADATGFKAGLKAAGGIKSPDQVAEWLDLVRDHLGSAALGPSRFRIGASSLLSALMG